MTVLLHRLLLRAVIAIVVACVVVTGGQAQDASQPSSAIREGPLVPPPEFVAVDRLLGSGGVRLAGGQIVKASDWQAVAVARGALTCTASLVGREVILTSAHCVDGRPYAPRIQIVLGSVTFRGAPVEMTECSAHPNYAAAGANGMLPRSGADLALCRLRTPVRDITLETIGADALDIGRGVILMGFGCRELRVTKGQLDVVPDPEGSKILRLGDQTIQAAGLALGSTEPLLSRTEGTGGRPNICPGDSGGPVFTGASAAKSVKGRRISGLNSAFNGDWGLSVPTPKFYSYLAPVTASFRRWALAWANERSLTVCGINRDPGFDGCRR